MRTWVLAACCAAALLAAAVEASPAGEKYTNRYDHINIDAILANPRALRAYVNCILEKGECSPEARELKENIPDALQTSCAKCNPSQKNLLRKAIRYLRVNDKPSLDLITKHYDPQGKYRKQFAEFVDSNN